jgi:hypothetical protein
MDDIQDVTPEAHELGTVLLEAVEQVQEAVSGLRGLKYPMDGSCTPVHCVPVKR